MASGDMAPFLAADLAALFDYDFPTTVIIGAKTYDVLLGDDSVTETDAFGGPEAQDTQQIHFKVSDLASIENGEVLELKQGTKTQQKLVVSSLISADGVELIAYVRAA